MNKGPVSIYYRAGPFFCNLFLNALSGKKYFGSKTWKHIHHEGHEETRR